jgi:hypothetical protein
MTRKPTVMNNFMTFDSTTYAPDFYVFLDCDNIELRESPEFSTGFVSIDIDFEIRMTAIKFKLFFQIMSELGGSITILNLLFLVTFSYFIFNDWLNSTLESINSKKEISENKE